MNACSRRWLTLCSTLALSCAAAPPAPERVTNVDQGARLFTFALTRKALACIEKNSPAAQRKEFSYVADLQPAGDGTPAHPHIQGLGDPPRTSQTLRCLAERAGAMDVPDAPPGRYMRTTIPLPVEPERIWYRFADDLLTLQDPPLQNASARSAAGPH